MTLESCHVGSGLWDADELVRDPLLRLQTWGHGTLPAKDTKYADGSHTRLPQAPPNYDSLRRIITALRDGLCNVSSEMTQR